MTDTVRIRMLCREDIAGWAQMRASLWPEASVEVHATEIDALLEDPEAWAFVVETTDRRTIGFAEVAVRKYANGCETRPVAFLEGIWVGEGSRRRGIAARLVRHIERFLAQRGFRELGSDALIDNPISQAAHLGWGFSETERVVYYRKTLAPPAGATE